MESGFQYLRSRTKLGGSHSTYNRQIKFFLGLHVWPENFGLAVRMVARKLRDVHRTHNYERHDVPRGQEYPQEHSVTGGGGAEVARQFPAPKISFWLVGDPLYAVLYLAHPASRMGIPPAAEQFHMPS